MWKSMVGAPLILTAPRCAYSSARSRRAEGGRDEAALAHPP